MVGIIKEYEDSVETTGYLTEDVIVDLENKYSTFDIPIAKNLFRCIRDDSITSSLLNWIIGI